MYTEVNYKTKKDLKAAVASGEPVSVWQPGPFGSDRPINGKIVIEGPQYPLHRWYAQAVAKDGIVVVGSVR